MQHVRAPRIIHSPGKDRAMAQTLENRICSSNYYLLGSNGKLTPRRAL